jgi:hypothetical protein
METAVFLLQLTNYKRWPEPDASFEYTDERFLRTCGVRPAYVHDNILCGTKAQVVL